MSAEAPLLDTGFPGKPQCSGRGQQRESCLGLAGENTGVEKGAFSSKNVAVSVSGLKNSQPGPAAIVIRTEHDWLQQGVPWDPGARTGSLINTRRRESGATPFTGL